VNSKYKFFGDDVDDIQLKHKDYEHIAKYPVYNFRHYLTKLGFKENNSPVPNLDLKLSASELAAKTLYGIVQNDKKTICIFTLPPLTSAIRIMVGSFYDRKAYQTIILLRYYPLKMYLK
jgi:hypothetical protein